MCSCILSPACKLPLRLRLQVPPVIKLHLSRAQRLPAHTLSTCCVVEMLVPRNDESFSFEFKLRFRQSPGMQLCLPSRAILFQHWLAGTATWKKELKCRRSWPMSMRSLSEQALCCLLSPGPSMCLSHEFRISSAVHQRLRTCLYNGAT